MATELRRRVQRKTIGRNHMNRALVVALAPGDVLEFREERSRKTFTISIARAYAIAVQLTVDAEKARKRAERKERRKQDG